MEPEEIMKGIEEGLDFEQVIMNLAYIQRLQDLQSEEVRQLQKEIEDSCRDLERRDEEDREFDKASEERKHKLLTKIDTDEKKYTALKAKSDGKRDQCNAAKDGRPKIISHSSTHAPLLTQLGLVYDSNEKKFCCPEGKVVVRPGDEGGTGGCSYWNCPKFIKKPLND